MIILWFQLLIIAVVLRLNDSWGYQYGRLPKVLSRNAAQYSRKDLKFFALEPKTPEIFSVKMRKRIVKSISICFNIITSSILVAKMSRAVEDSRNNTAASAVPSNTTALDLSNFKVPYFHTNLPIQKFLGEKATLVVNMKLDDPQTAIQFPGITELYRRYGNQGLNILVFPTDQGWFEPDDDETCRVKAKEYYKFGDFPHAVVFDKVDLLGPSASPFIRAITEALPTPNGYSRITLNYEKILLNAAGQPVRRYPRKCDPLDLSADIEALIRQESLPTPSPQFLQLWREAKKEVPKSEYSFRFNYNYYYTPNSMYKYNPLNDATTS